MTYDLSEKSTYGGAPVELYQFDREGSQSWRYTSGDEDVEYLGQTYTSIPITRSRVEQSQDVNRASITVTMGSFEEFIQQFIISPPFARIGLTIRRYHQGSQTEIIALWTGRIINVFQKESKADIKCESSYSSLQRPTLRRVYSLNCPHLLYGSICQVSQTSFETVAALTAINGLTITSPAFGTHADGYYSGGIVESANAGVVTRRFVSNHVGNVITVNLPLYNATVGSSVNAYPGCGHNLADCNDKFGNVVNYGGFPYVPEKNPINGTSIY